MCRTIAQVSYASFKTNMRPTHSPLSSKLPLAWSPELKATFKVSSKEIIKQHKLGVKSFNPSLPTYLARDWNKFGTAPAKLQHPCPAPPKGAVLGCCDTSQQTVFMDNKSYTKAEPSYAPIVTPRNTNQKVQRLPFHSTPVQTTGKMDVTPNCPAKQTDTPGPLPLPLAPPIELGIFNVKAGYREDHQRAEDLEDLLANLDPPSVETLEDKCESHHHQSLPRSPTASRAPSHMCYIQCTVGGG